MAWLLGMLDSFKSLPLCPKQVAFEGLSRFCPQVANANFESSGRIAIRRAAFKSFCALFVFHPTTPQQIVHSA